MSAAQAMGLTNGADSFSRDFNEPSSLSNLFDKRLLSVREDGSNVSTRGWIDGREFIKISRAS